MASRSLTDLPRALTEAGFEPVTYAILHRAAMNGTIPVSRNVVGTRWVWSEDDLGAIADALGLGTAYAA